MFHFPNSKHVSTWLLSTIIMVVLMILIVGVTRLTDSGLSITSILVELGAWGKDNLSNYNQLMNKKESLFRLKTTKKAYTKSLKNKYKTKIAKTEFIKI